MDKVLILVNRKISVDKKLTRYLNTNSKNKLKFELHTFSELFFEIKTGKAKIKINSFDIANYKLVFIRRAGKYIRSIGGIITYLDFKKTKFVDPAYRHVGLSLDKSSSALRLAIKKVPVPYTVFCYRESIIKNKEKIIKELKFPIIAKAIFSEQNRDIYILKNSKDFDTLVQKNEKEFIFQTFIDFEKEYRFLILGEKVCVLEQKFKRNYENLKVEYQDLIGPSIFLDIYCATQDESRIALKASAVLGLDISGVDLAVEKLTKNVFVIEVNKGPGIEPNARTSPELKAFSDYLLSRMS